MNEIENLNKIKENYKFDLYKYKEFCIDFTYHTQKIEGSTLTEEENRDLILNNNIPEKNHCFVIEHQKHYDLLMRDFIWHEVELTNKLIMGWHWRMFKDTKPKIAGNLRSWNVGIRGTNVVFPTWNEVPYYLEDFYIWYNNTKGGIHPVYLAALAHLKFVSIHPFGDGNGRTSRLIMNFILHKNGYPMLNIPYDDKRNYYYALETAQSGKGDWRFVEYIVKKYISYHGDII
jgi:Fic family protein